MATHSSVFAWKIPWTEESGGLQSMESQRVGYNNNTPIRMDQINKEGSSTQNAQLELT